MSYLVIGVKTQVLPSNRGDVPVPALHRRQWRGTGALSVVPHFVRCVPTSESRWFVNALVWQQGHTMLLYFDTCLMLCTTYFLY